MTTLPLQRCCLQVDAAFRHTPLLPRDLPDTGGALRVDVFYVVLYATADQNLAYERLAAQHAALVEAFVAGNADRALVPASGPYGFAAVLGDPQIAFSALAPEHVLRVDTQGDARPFTSTAGAQQWFADQGIALPATGVVCVVVPELDGILGLAELGGRFTLVIADAIGGPDAPGALADFALGRTLVHEVGHLLNLPHVFSATCDAGAQFADIPPQRLPNYFATLSPEPGGCHRQTACAAGATGAALAGQVCPDPGEAALDCAAAEPQHEMFMNYMDYVADPDMVAFSAEQALAMRAHALANLAAYQWAEDPTAFAGERTAAATGDVVALVLGIFFGVVALGALGLAVWRRWRP